MVQCSGHPDTKACTPIPSRLFQFHLEEEWSMAVQTRRDISRTVEDRGKLLLSLIGSHICRVDWHNNGWPWVTLNAMNGRFTFVSTVCLLEVCYYQCNVYIVYTKMSILRIARYLCGSSASCYLLLESFLDISAAWYAAFVRNIGCMSFRALAETLKPKHQSSFLHNV